MGYPTKIVTCCYCGTRAALVLKGRDRHELSCSSCGAPLHLLKQIPSGKKPSRSDGFDHSVGWEQPGSERRKVKKYKKKKKKSLFRKAMGEAFDLIEDIFD